MTTLDEPAALPLMRAVVLTAALRLAMHIPSPHTCKLSSSSLNNPLFFTTLLIQFAALECHFYFKLGQGEITINLLANSCIMQGE